MERRKNKKLSEKNREKPVNCRRPTVARLGRAGQHGRVVWHGLAVPVLWPACVNFPEGARPCTPIARSCLACFVRVVLLLVPRASLYLYPSPESSRNVTFSNKTRRFFLKTQKSCNINKTASEEANIYLSLLD